MAIEWALPAQPFVLYDGTNSAELCAAIEEHYADNDVTATVTSEGCGSVTIHVVGATVGSATTYTIAVGEHFGVQSGHQASPAVWAERYVKV